MTAMFLGIIIMAAGVLVMLAGVSIWIVMTVEQDL